MKKIVKDFNSTGITVNLSLGLLIIVFFSDSIFSFVPGDFEMHFLWSNYISIIFLLGILIYNRNAFISENFASDLNLPNENTNSVSNILRNKGDEFEILDHFDIEASPSKIFIPITSKEGKNRFNVAFGILVIAFILVGGQFFIYLKEFQSHFEHSKILDIFNYPNFFIVLVVSTSFNYRKIFVGSIRKTYIG